MTGPSRRAQLPPLPSPTAIPAELADQIADAKARLEEAHERVAQIWSLIDRVSESGWPRDSQLSRFVLSDDAGPEVERRLHGAQTQETDARVDLIRLEREAERIRREVDNPPGPAAPPTPLPQGDRVTPLGPGRGGSL